MNAEIKAVAARLRGLRDSLDVSVEDAAAVCGIRPGGRPEGKAC